MSNTRVSAIRASGAAEPPTAATQMAGGAAAPTSRLDMRYLVRALLKYNASDLHVKVGRPPLYRINGRLVPAKMPELTPEQVESILFGVMTDRQATVLEKDRDVDFSFHIKDFGRFRCNAYHQRGQLSAAVRMIPLTVPSLTELGIPAVVRELCTRNRGLVLVTGATGSGKSTTLASMVQHINETQYGHVLTIEDPIEFVFKDAKSTITQREVGSDCRGLTDGLRAGLRQDPDVIVIGELRDCDMIQSALTAAETGHLVLTTLHTNDVKSTIERFLDGFPADVRTLVRVQLAGTLVGIVAQQLVVKKDGNGRVPACEILVRSPIIEKYILEGELDKIQDALSNSGAYYKMQTMNQALERLVVAGTVTAEEALRSSNNPDDLKLRLSGVSRDEGYEAMNDPFHPQG